MERGFFCLAQIEFILFFLSFLSYNYSTIYNTMTEVEEEEKNIQKKEKKTLFDKNFQTVRST